MRWYRCEAAAGWPCHAELHSWSWLPQKVAGCLARHKKAQAAQAVRPYDGDHGGNQSIDSWIRWAVDFSSRVCAPAREFLHPFEVRTRTMTVRLRASAMAVVFLAFGSFGSSAQSVLLRTPNVSGGW